MAEKLVIMLTHGPEDPELASIPFVMGIAALASDIEVIVGFQAAGVMLVKEGCAQHVRASGFDPLNVLIDTFIEEGGQIFVCGPCVTARNIDAEKDFIKGAKVVNAATFVSEVTSATNVLVY